MSFVHLEVHSNYSLLSGASPVEHLVERAAALGMPALALTDTNGMRLGTVSRIGEGRARRPSFFRKIAADTRRPAASSRRGTWKRDSRFGTRSGRFQKMFSS
jgi:hypothetical protein